MEQEKNEQSHKILIHFLKIELNEPRKGSSFRIKRMDTFDEMAF